MARPSVRTNQSKVVNPVHFNYDEIHVIVLFRIKCAKSLVFEVKS